MVCGGGGGGGKTMLSLLFLMGSIILDKTFDKIGANLPFLLMSLLVRVLDVLFCVNDCDKSTVIVRIVIDRRVA